MQRNEPHDDGQFSNINTGRGVAIPTEEHRERMIFYRSTRVYTQPQKNKTTPTMLPCLIAINTNVVPVEIAA